MQSMVQPYTGSSTFLPLLHSGEIDFAIVNAVEMNLGYQGPTEVKDRRQKSVTARAKREIDHARLAIIGRPRGQERLGIKNVQEVKGKRVTGEYPANIAIW